MSGIAAKHPIGVSHEKESARRHGLRRDRRGERKAGLSSRAAASVCGEPNSSRRIRRSATSRAMRAMGVEMVGLEAKIGAPLLAVFSIALLLCAGDGHAGVLFERPEFLLVVAGGRE